MALVLQFLQARVDIEQRGLEIVVRVRNRCELFHALSLVPIAAFFFFLTKNSDSLVVVVGAQLFVALLAASMLASREEIRVDSEKLFHRRSIAGVGVPRTYRLEDIRGLRAEEGAPPVYRGQQETWHGGYPRIWFDDHDGIIKIGRGLTVEDARNAVQAICSFQPRLCAGYVPTEPGVVLTLGL